MRCRSAHELDEMIIFLSGITVTLNISDNLAIYLAGRVETEGGLNPLVLEVAVDGLGHADHLDVGADILVLLGENGRVGVGVVAADDNESLDVELLEDFQAGLELLRGLELRAARAYDVEAAGVPIFLDISGSQLHILMVDESGGTHQEAVETAFAVEALDAVENSAHHVVAAGGLATRQDYSTRGASSVLLLGM